MTSIVVCLGSALPAGAMTAPTCQTLFGAEAVSVGIAKNLSDIHFSNDKEPWERFAQAGHEFVDDHPKNLRNSERQQIALTVVETLLFGPFIEDLAMRGFLENTAVSTATMTAEIERFGKSTKSFERSQIVGRLNNEVIRWSDATWNVMMEFVLLAKEPRHETRGLFTRGEVGVEEFKMAQREMARIAADPVKLAYAKYLIGLSAFEIQEMIHAGKLSQLRNDPDKKLATYQTNDFYGACMNRRIPGARKLGVAERLKMFVGRGSPMFNFEMRAKRVLDRAHILRATQTEISKPSEFKPQADRVSQQIGALGNWVIARLTTPTAKAVEDVGFEILSDHFTVKTAMSADLAALKQLLVETQTTSASVQRMKTIELVRNDFESLVEIKSSVEQQFASFQANATSVALSDSSSRRVNIVASETAMNQSRAESEMLRDKFASLYEEILQSYASQK